MRCLGAVSIMRPENPLLLDDTIEAYMPLPTPSGSLENKLNPRSYRYGVA